MTAEGVHITGRQCAYAFLQNGFGVVDDILNGLDDIDEGGNISRVQVHTYSSDCGRDLGGGQREGLNDFLEICSGGCDKIRLIRRIICSALDCARYRQLV